MTDRSQKLDSHDVAVMRWMLGYGVSQRSLAIRYGISKSHMSAIANRKIWRTVKPAADCRISAEDRFFADLQLRKRVERVKLDEQKVRRIRNLRQMGIKYSALAERFGVTTSTIRKAVFGATWREVQ